MGGELEFRALGILSTLVPSQMAWEINRISGFQLVRKPDLQIGRGSATTYHALFSHVDEDMEAEVVLIRNKGTAGVLLPVYRKLDYVLLESAGFDTYLTASFDLMQSKFIQYCSEIKPDPVLISEIGVFEL